MRTVTTLMAILNGLLLCVPVVHGQTADQNSNPPVDLREDGLEELRMRCIGSHSSSYALQIEGEVLLQSKSMEQVPSHSVLKSIQALAVARLLTLGVLTDIDLPVWHLYPEWKQGFRKQVTIRHLMNHTSGIESLESMMEDWQDAEDMVQIALCADLISMPGDSFLYNNKAAILLMGVIGRLSGIAPERFIEEEIFAPLGITDVSWQTDAKGHPTVLNITSGELLKIGQLLLDEGMVGDSTLIRSELCSLILGQGQEYVANSALLWWIIPERTEYIVDDLFLDQLRDAEINEDIVEKFKLLKGRYSEVNIPDELLVKVFGEEWEEYLESEFYPYFPSRSRREYSDEIIGYKAEGWLGQYLVIYPEKKIVAARMIENSSSYNQQTDSMQDFEKLVYQVVK